MINNLVQTTTVFSSICFESQSDSSNTQEKTSLPCNKRLWTWLFVLLWKVHCKGETGILWGFLFSFYCFFSTQQSSSLKRKSDRCCWPLLTQNPSVTLNGYRRPADSHHAQTPFFSRELRGLRGIIMPPAQRHSWVSRWQTKEGAFICS